MSNNHWLQLRIVKCSLWSPEEDGQQQQKTIPLLSARNMKVTVAHVHLFTITGNHLRWLLPAGYAHVTDHLEYDNESTLLLEPPVT